jgi:hypothetical protein
LLLAVVVLFWEQCSQPAKNKIPFSQGASPKVFFLNYPGRQFDTCKLAISAREETEDGSLWSIVKSPPIFSPTLDGVTPNPSPNLHLSAIKRGHRMPPSCSPEVEGGLALGAWPFPLYLRQQLEEDNIFSSLHTRIDRASSSSFFFFLCFFLLLDLKPLHRSILASLLFFFPKDLASFFLQISLKLIQSSFSF